MIRDPFNIHKNNAFKATAFRTAQNIKDTATQAGASALEMSFSIPKNVPSFSNPQRNLEDRFWGSGQSSNRTGAGMMNNVFGGEQSLPMYKDKPYAYAPSQRNRPLWRRKRIVGTVTLVIIGLLYFMGFFSRDTSKKPLTDWGRKSSTQDKGKADWNMRRDRVVEAFELSWDAYERYAWGELGLVIRGIVNLANLVMGQATMNTTQSRKLVNIWLPRAWAGLSSTLWTL